MKKQSLSHATDLYYEEIKRVIISALDDYPANRIKKLKARELFDYIHVINNDGMVQEDIQACRAMWYIANNERKVNTLIKSYLSKESKQ